MKKYYFTVLQILLLVQLAFTATYYVDVDSKGGTANDSGPGTPITRPWKTLNRAVSATPSVHAKAGDTVFVRAGIYREMVTITVAGTSMAPFTVKAYNKESAVLDGGNTLRGGIVTNTDYVTIDGLSVKNYVKDGIAVMNAHISMKNLDVANGMYAVHFFGGANYCTISQSYIHHSGSHNIFIERCTGTVVEACHLGATPYFGNFFCNIEIGAATDTQILNCEIDSSGGQGIHPIMGTRGLLVKGCRIHDGAITGINGETDCKHMWFEGNVIYGNSRAFQGETGIWTDENVDVVVQNNLIYDNCTGMWCSQAARVLYRWNVVYNNRGHVAEPHPVGFMMQNDQCHNNPPSPCKLENNALVHNTFYNSGTDNNNYRNAGSLIYGTSNAPIGTNVILNNIFQENHGPNVAELSQNPGVMDGNIYHQSGDGPANISYLGRSYTVSDPGGFSEYQNASGIDLHSFADKANFVNPSAGDFSLTQGSIAIDQAQPLAHVKSDGAGKSLPVDDARCFSAGFRTLTDNVLLVPGDRIMVAGKLAQVMARDTSTSVLTLDRYLTWKKGDPVCYEYAGNGPDIGAMESGINMPSIQDGKSGGFSDKTFGLGHIPAHVSSAGKVNYEIPRNCHVRLTIQNAMGQTVKTLANANTIAGKYQAAWDAWTHGSGVYLIRLAIRNPGEGRELLVTRKISVFR